MVQESKMKYEEIREKRLEENKKKMEELKLNKLSVSLHKPTPRPSPAKQRVLRRTVDLTPVRRSTRMANKPLRSYKEVPIEPLKIPRSYNRRNLLNRMYASNEERIYAIERAEILESNLESEYPSFVKPMLQSHVTGGFWLGLPLHFCKKHLPHVDEIITLVDEEGDEFQTKYLIEKNGLSGGWRGFSIEHQLVDGDALVFQLVKPTVFKVYIIRVYEKEDSEDKEVDSGDKSDVTHLDRSAKRIRAGKKQ
ncbi:B3 domain-containing protein At3g19184-like [Tripterygium wilfordii]|uniref:B3 domain-containing protein At3g19184-like n=1 Tax=Tripterygium wilfordii TaxID=458696 RepID=UPI0018F84177|nr:B3 domain-containing protein At3g19184-like [Tripterygium wilfordii]